MATTKSAGSTKLGRDYSPKYLGVKLYEGQKVKIGMVIIRQRGSKFIPGKNVKKGSDDTLYAIKDGFVFFKEKRIKNFDNNQRKAKIVYVSDKK